MSVAASDMVSAPRADLDALRAEVRRLRRELGRAEALRLIQADPLGATPPQPRAIYRAAAAEQIPVRDSSADLATVGASFRWFDQSRALAEGAPGGPFWQGSGTA